VAESENIVVETAERIFADLADAQTINRDSKGGWKAPLWQALTEAGLPLSWVAEDCGGSGASLAEGFSVLSAAGRFAIAVPLAETMLAGWLLSQAKIASPEGAMTVAPASPKDRITLGADGTLSGRARGVPFAKDAGHLAVLAQGAAGLSIALVAASACRIEAGLNLASDGNDTVTFNNVQPAAIKPAPTVAVTSEEGGGVLANTVDAFGLGDYEFILANESDDPAELAAMMMALRATEVRRYTKLDTPIFLGRRREAAEALADL